MTHKEFQAILQRAISSGAIHHAAQLMNTGNFKKLEGITVGNMGDITYANPDKLNIRAHASKKARITHKFVLFYTYQGQHKVISAGSLESIAGYVEYRERIYAFETETFGV
jgi:hypothetical protein